MEKKDLILVAMPWPSLNRTPIQLGILKPLVQQAGFSVSTRSFFLSAIEYFISCTEHLPPSDRISVSDYNTIIQQWKAGTGDWIFAVPPYKAYSSALDNEYFSFLRDQAISEEFIGKIIRLRDLVPAFLEQCLADILSESPTVVGFSSTFSQNIPSLVLSKMLKEQDPSVHIIFGGANCDGPMGAALHRSFPWIDTVVRGEAEAVLPELMRDICKGEPIRPQANLCYRKEGKAIVAGGMDTKTFAMDDVPTPNYDEYFSRLNQSRLHDELSPDVELLFESARGCWWGEKMHCTFCGLNGSTMKFRSKSPSRVVNEIYELASKYKRINFEAVDNIIDMDYLKELLPQLHEYRRRGIDFSIFYETKANLKKSQLRLMRDAGLRQIQPGIESLSTSILKLMRKGITGLQNIRLLKWAIQYGIDVNWNMLYGFPGEATEEYERMADTMQSLTHLQPPAAASSLVIERFSPYHQDPARFGLIKVKPTPYYKYVYPTDEKTLNDIAYDFTHEYEDGSDPSKHVEIIQPIIELWQDGYRRGANSLTYKRGPGFLTICDRRSNLEASDYHLADTEAHIYLLCDAGATPLGIWNALAATEQAGLTLQQVIDFLESLVVARLVYKEDGLYLSLATSNNVDALDFEAEPQSANEVEVMAPVQIIPSRARLVAS
jgi:ribosomal peptide maturation radical SAM protein 1